MLSSLALIFMVGLLSASLCKRLKLPGIVGMLATGIVLGPHLLNFIDSKTLLISPELRQIALIIILLKAGFSLNINNLKQIGKPAILMSFVPASFEILAFYIFAPYLLGLSKIDALIMGSVLAAVSPAVVVPRMVKLMETGYGTNKNIPELIMAGASCDDVFVIVLFTSFVGMAQGTSLNFVSLLGMPVSIVLGISLGIALGLALSFYFEWKYNQKHHIRNSLKLIIIISFSFLLVASQDWLKNTLPFSGLIAVMSMASVISLKSTKHVCLRLGNKFGKLWLAAELLLFVLVGCVIDSNYMLNTGINVVLIIFIALLFRAIGVIVCLIGTNLNAKERLFCVLAYLPKATVQAAIGSVPLAMGLGCGNIVLSVAVFAILISAPLGAFAIDYSYKTLLSKNI